MRHNGAEVLTERGTLVADRVDDLSERKARTEDAARVKRMLSGQFSHDEVDTATLAKLVSALLVTLLARGIISVEDVHQMRDDVLVMP